MQEYDCLFKSGEFRICIPLPVLIRRYQEHVWQLLTKIDVFSRIFFKKNPLAINNRENEEFVLDLDTPGTHLIQATFASYFVNAPQTAVLPLRPLAGGPLPVAPIGPSLMHPRRRFFLCGLRPEVCFRQLRPVLRSSFLASSSSRGREERQRSARTGGAAALALRADGRSDVLTLIAPLLG
jgi:hypothetical protein